ncbi:MAG TPA: nicotinamide mononucleotide transporter [Ruminococcaceae bacterium]|nr:nicotinamide mononucleotide transporter [Oscillospiraceae bacterium]HAY72248.1 nicotinamide mononucleotide transporter [Oscillospiraceae bacterium]
MSLKKYFSIGELLLWGISAAIILVSFFIFDKENYVTLVASLIGVTSLIFNAKGNPLGPLLIIIFSGFYGYISYTFDYYGEMITYLGMSAPIAAVALVSWLKNPFKGNKAQVTIDSLRKKDVIVMFIIAAVVTAGFYFILGALGTANMIPSTISVTTSFLAVYLTYKRSEYYALAYAANDVVLIVLWIMATIKDISYLSVIICFAVFLVNDIYGFINWKRMKQIQRKSLA